MSSERPTTAPSGRLCLITGATGYVGGRLVPQLLEAGYRVRVLTRRANRLRDRPWYSAVEVSEGDASSADDVAEALAGVDVAYYLIHSLGTGSDFEEKDRTTAETFAAAAREAKIGRLVYLGGLAPQGEELSPHLRSRVEVGNVMLASGVPTAVLRAAVIIGSGSLSFEMLRHLTERLPAMITPRWVTSRIQPIAIADVLHYLVGAATLPADVSRPFDIGGPDVLTYADMMQGYAKVAGLKRRRILPVPVLTPQLSSRWIGLVTPVPTRVARPLVESLRNTVVCTEHDIARYVPDPPEGLLSFEDAVARALQRIQEFKVPTSWSSAAEPGAPSEPLPTDPDWAGGSLYQDVRSSQITASPESLWYVIEGIGGRSGWYSYPLFWWIRGLLDSLYGGPGLRRGRRDPHRLEVGDALDWWRVEEVDRGKMLRLRAEMRLPGLAWLELSVEKPEASAEDGAPAGKPQSVLHQRALFHPRGLAGHAYWWSVWPFHGVVFGQMQRNIAKAAEKREAATGETRKKA